MSGGDRISIELNGASIWRRRLPAARGERVGAWRNNAPRQASAALCVVPCHYYYYYYYYYYCYYYYYYCLSPLSHQPLMSARNQRSQVVRPDPRDDARLLLLFMRARARVCVAWCVSAVRECSAWREKMPTHVIEKLREGGARRASE